MSKIEKLLETETFDDEIESRPAFSPPARTGADAQIADEMAGFRRGKAANPAAIVGGLLTYKKGLWYLGSETLPTETGLFVFLTRAQHGLVRWSGDLPVEYRIGRVFQGFIPPPREKLGHDDESLWPLDKDGRTPRDPWQRTYFLYGELLPGDELVTFSTSSFYGRDACERLVDKYGWEGRKYAYRKWPVVQLGSTSIQTRKYGPIPAPTLNIVEWRDRPDLDPAPEEPPAAPAAKPVQTLTSPKAMAKSPFPGDDEPPLSEPPNEEPCEPWID